MSRREFPNSIRLAAFKRAAGHCEICTALLFTGKFEYHHDKEATFGGEASLKNVRVLCINCHSGITRTRAPVIAKSNRVRARHAGITKPKGTIPSRKFDRIPIPPRRVR